MKRMSFLGALLCAFLLTSNLYAQTKSLEESLKDSIILEVADEKIPASEFLYMFDKNNASANNPQYQTERYLELFINFKLKVHDALAKKIDTTSHFQREYNSYRHQAVAKYLRDDEAIEKLCREAYERLKVDRKVAHIAIECKDTTDVAKRDSALAKIQWIRQRVTTGVPSEGKKKKKIEPESFFKVAAETSTDNSARDSGRIGWVVPFRFVYEFENAAYNTPVGQVSEIFHTTYGYHIVFVEEEVPHKEVHSAHIMRRIVEGQEARAKHEIDSIYNLLKNGNDFATLASTYSDDAGSAVKGGDLGWSSVGRMVAPFEKAIFSTPAGQITAPFESQYGWHIAKVIDVKEVDAFEKLHNQIEAAVLRDTRVFIANNAFIEKTRKEYNLPDTMSVKGVYDYADEHIADKYPELKPLLKEYFDGILLFDVSMQEVWNKSTHDVAGITAFFNSHRKQFNWDAPRYKGFALQCKDERVANIAKSIINNASAGDSVENILRRRLTIDTVEYVKFEKGIWKEGENALVDVYGFNSTKAKFTPSADYPYVTVVGKIQTVGPDDYTDRRADVTTAYQNQLDRLWLIDLLKKYPVKVHKPVVDAIKEVRDK